MSFLVSSTSFLEKASFIQRIAIDEVSKRYAKITAIAIGILALFALAVYIYRSWEVKPISDPGTKIPKPNQPIDNDPNDPLQPFPPRIPRNGQQQSRHTTRDIDGSDSKDDLLSSGQQNLKHLRRATSVRKSRSGTGRLSTFRGLDELDDQDDLPPKKLSFGNETPSTSSKKVNFGSGFKLPPIASNPSQNLKPVASAPTVQVPNRASKAPEAPQVVKETAKQKLARQDKLSKEFFTDFKDFCGEIQNAYLHSSNRDFVNLEIFSIIGRFSNADDFWWSKKNKSLGDQLEELLTEIIDKYAQVKRIPAKYHGKIGRQVPSYHANVKNDIINTSEEKIYFGLLGFRNLLKYGPEIIDEFREKRFIGLSNHYSHGKGVYKAKTFTGQVVDLDIEFDAKSREEAIEFARDQIILFATKLAPKAVEECIRKNNYRIDPNQLKTHEIIDYGIRSGYIYFIENESEEVALQKLIFAFGKRHGFKKPDDEKDAKKILDRIRKLATQKDREALHSDINLRILPGRNLHFPQKGQAFHAAADNNDRGKYGIWTRQHGGKFKHYVNVANLENVFNATVSTPYMLAELLYLTKEKCKEKNDYTLLDEFYNRLFEDDDNKVEAFGGLSSKCLNDKANSLNIFYDNWKLILNPISDEDIIRDNLLKGAYQVEGKNILSKQPQIIEALIKSAFTLDVFIQEFLILLEDVPKADTSIPKGQWIDANIPVFKKLIKEPKTFQFWLEQNQEKFNQILNGDLDRLRDIKVDDFGRKVDQSTLWENCLYRKDEQSLYVVFNDRVLSEVLDHYYVSTLHGLI